MLNQGATPAPGQQTGRVTQNPLQNPQILPEPTVCPSPGAGGRCRNAPTRLPADLYPHPLPVGWPRGTRGHPDAAACHHGSLLCHQPGLVGPGAALVPFCWEMPTLHQHSHVARRRPIFLRHHRNSVPCSMLVSPTGRSNTTTLIALGNQQSQEAAGSRLPTAGLGAALLAELPPQNSPATLSRSAIRLPGTGLSPLPSHERGRRLPVPVPTPGARSRRLLAPQPPHRGRPRRRHWALQLRPPLPQPPQNHAGAVPTCPRATHGTRRTAVQPVQPVLHLLLRRDGGTAAPPATSP